jgi:hypothetical protein
MVKTTVIAVSLIFASCCTYAQAVSDSLLQVGQVYYKKKDFINAGKKWTEAAESADNKISKQSYFFYAAHAYAEANDSSNAFKNLEWAILNNGFNDLPVLQEKETFGFMDQSARWAKLVGAIKPAYSTDPIKAKFIKTDVKNFWASYDLVKKDSLHAESIYKQFYIDQGSMALQDYYVNKMGGNMSAFQYVHSRKDKFYSSIRASTFKALDYSKDFRSSYINLKKIYPQAIFPDLYFVIGKLNSAGTSSSYGLILAIDQLCKTATTDLSELESWEQHYVNNFSNLSATVAHELIHFQQKEMASDTTLLKAAILEGMADFMGELISGKSANTQLQQFAKGKENLILNKFKAEMYLDRANNWVGNGDQDKPDWPSDLGYWVGYEICKSYYKNATNKQQAIFDMLHIKDYRKFLTDSKFSF